MSSISKNLRELNISGIAKATAVATAEYIEQLEKQLNEYKKLENKGMLIKLPLDPSKPFYEVTRCCNNLDYEEVDPTVFPVGETECEDCEIRECHRLTYEPREKHWKDAKHMLMYFDSKLFNVTFFDSLKKCQKACDKLNNKTTPLAAADTTKNNYIPRSELEADKLQQARANDRQYYASKAEYHRAKDRERYHKLHPNAKTYKRRTTTGQQLSFEDIGGND